jgi:hypothetical protein
MPVHSGRNRFASFRVAAATAAALLFMALMKISISSTMDVVEVELVSIMVRLPLLEEKLDAR